MPEEVAEEVAEDAGAVVSEVEGAAAGAAAAAAVAAVAAAASLFKARLGGVGGGARVRGEASERVHPGKSEGNPPGVQAGAGEQDTSSGCVSSGESSREIAGDRGGSVSSGERSRASAGERARSRSSCAVSGDGSKAGVALAGWGESCGEGGGGLCKPSSVGSRLVRRRIAVAPPPGEGR